VKYLVLFLVFLFFAWRWRAARIAPVRDANKPRQPKGDPQAVVACDHCGLHIPAADALDGSRGVYCSAAHRQLREG
jgi:uncharacterized protein